MKWEQSWVTVWQYIDGALNRVPLSNCLISLCVQMFWSFEFYILLHTPVTNGPRSSGMPGMSKEQGRQVPSSFSFCRYTEGCSCWLTCSPPGQTDCFSPPPKATCQERLGVGWGDGAMVMWTRSRHRQLKAFIRTLLWKPDKGGLLIHRVTKSPWDTHLILKITSGVGGPQSPGQLVGS